MTDIERPNNIVPETEMARRRRVHELVEQIADGVLDIGTGFLELKRDLGLTTAEILQLVISRMPPKVQVLMEEETRDLLGGTSLLVGTIDEAYSTLTGQKVADFIGIAANLTPNGERMYDPDPGPGDFVRVPMLGSVGRSVRLPLGSPLPSPDAMREAYERRMRHEDDYCGVRRMRTAIERLFAEAPALQSADGTPVEGQAPALEVTLVLRANIPPIQGVMSQAPEGLLRLMTPAEVPDTSPGARPNAKKKILIEQFFDYADVVAVCVERDVKASGSRLFSS